MPSNPYMGYTNVYQLASTPYTPTMEDIGSGLAFQLMYPAQTTDEVAQSVSPTATTIPSAATTTTIPSIANYQYTYTPTATNRSGFGMTNPTYNWNTPVSTQASTATTATTPTVATTTYNNTPVSTPAFQDSQSTTSTTQYNDIQSQISALIKSLMQPTTTSTGSTTSGTTSTPTGNYASSGFGSLYGFPQDTFYDTRKTGWNAGTNW